MTQSQFARWIRRQGLANHQITMAAILYAINGYDSAVRFVKQCQLMNDPRKALNENQPIPF